MEGKSDNAVTIAGSGVAGASSALRALQVGLEPTLLRTPSGKAVGGVEILPASAWRMLEELDLGSALASIRPGYRDGLRLVRADGEVEQIVGRAIHVDRMKLRTSLVREAVRRGARVIDVARLPEPEPDAFQIDATGQRAAWSKPTRRQGREMADIFTAPTNAAVIEAGVALLGPRWAYVASDSECATVGVISPAKSRLSSLDDEVRLALNLPPSMRFRHVGRRPAFVQWTSPVQGLRLSVGDAAVQHSPIGGRGISFALGSAFAAIAVVATWRERPADAELCRDFYRDYVAAELRRHLSFLAGRPKHDHKPIGLDQRLHWIGNEVPAAIVVNGRIVAGRAFRTRSAGIVRWAGGFDLLKLAELASRSSFTMPALIGRLVGAGINSDEARNLIEWACGQGLIG